jgi:two-component system sensor histidine kinase GlrK
VTARRAGDDVELEVLDDGPGIAPEERSLVFEPFYRGRNASDALVKGTGIGLSVVREYAQMHGGSAEVVERGRGAHIRVRLPLAAERRARAAESPATSAEGVR